MTLTPTLPRSTRPASPYLNRSDPSNRSATGFMASLERYCEVRRAIR
jgi:hypothetical protein